MSAETSPDPGRRALWGGGLALLLAAVLYLLGPVLTPFLVAALLAYLGDPWVDRLEARYSRTLAVVLVFALILLLGLLALLLLLPALGQQLATFIARVPDYLAWGQERLLPLLHQVLGQDGQPLFDPQQLRALLLEHWGQAKGLAAGLFSVLIRSGGALVAWAANLILVPVLTFYLLRDWDELVGRLHALLPRDLAPRVSAVAREVDATLSGFLRGQLAVMAALALIYSLGLWAVGLDLALFFGTFAGLVSFVPYLGAISGVLLAGGAALMQGGGPWILAGVLAVFGAGQLLESFWLTPRLVGDRIGLHPVAVIFAVMAGGELFGFVGVLVGLPLAAVLAVLLRHAKAGYTASPYYQGGRATGTGAAQGPGEGAS